MPTKTVDVGEAKITLKELLSLVVEGTEIVLMEGSTPVARLVPYLITNYATYCRITLWGNLDKRRF
jgi:antitoxin (DNA-binding transcriptional repressor) of toxin-antitoxin stability system